MSRLVARVMIDSPLPQLDHLFDYRIPEELVGHVSAGVRVKVPFRSGGRILNGYVVEVFEPAGFGSHEQPAAVSAGVPGALPGALPGLAAAPFHGALSPLHELVSEARVLTQPVWELARSVADRAAGNVSDILRLAIPPRQVRVEKAWLAARSGPADTTVPADTTGPADTTVPAPTTGSGPGPAGTLLPPAFRG
ncbi:MAG: hypothetical protein R6W83_09900, partial [Cryobacterium sp.]